MEQTFITIHNLSADANILFASESIVDILGWQPQDVQGKSCFEFFHPEELPFARSIHNRGVRLDKAAVLQYAHILSLDGRWVKCECCFTIVHDVMVASTSVYRRGEKSHRRMIEAPQIRRIFSSSPRDPRYHMLEHLSPKFKSPPMEREPRAALILNRFTRTLTVMFATNAVSTILGVRPDQVQDKSFYECIAENCLQDAISCLESAKANDSIAYLRFWYRDPRREEDFDEEADADGIDGNFEDDERRSMATSDSSDSDGGANLGNTTDMDVDGVADGHDRSNCIGNPAFSKASTLVGNDFSEGDLASPTADEVDGANAREEPADVGQINRSRTSEEGRRHRPRALIPTFELEAVVSCTSDGLVVILRKARPPILALHPPLLDTGFENGLFAAPWSSQPIRPYYPPEQIYTFRSPFLPQFMPVQEHVKAAGGPPMDQLMKSIREVAVFAWALTGINGEMASYSRGTPSGEAQPHEGLPIWDPNASKSTYLGPEPARHDRFGDPSADRHLAHSVSASGLHYLHHSDIRGPQGYGATPPGFNHSLSGYPNSSMLPNPAPYTSTMSPWSYPRVEQQSQPSDYQYPKPVEPRIGASNTHPDVNSNQHNNRPVPTTHADGSYVEGRDNYKYAWQ